MAKKIGYIKTKKMEPRPGVKYATEYYIQTLKQRKEMLATVKQLKKELDNQRKSLRWKSMITSNLTHQCPQTQELGNKEIQTSSYGKQ